MRDHQCSDEKINYKFGCEYAVPGIIKMLHMAIVLDTKCVINIGGRNVGKTWASEMAKKAKNK